jgi:hypothetical protein
VANSCESTAEKVDKLEEAGNRMEKSEETLEEYDPPSHIKEQLVGISSYKV